jgi:hypothetical protein
MALYAMVGFHHPLVQECKMPLTTLADEEAKRSCQLSIWTDGGPLLPIEFCLTSRTRADTPASVIV